MRKSFYPEIESIFNRNDPMPMVSVTEIYAELDKDISLIGAFEIVNNGEGKLTGMVESINGRINIDDPRICTNRQVISYQIDTYSLKAGQTYTDSLVITYNGGEILIPVTIKVIGSGKQPVKGYKAKETKEEIEIYTNKGAYFPDDTGYITVHNPHGNVITVKVFSDEPNISFKESQVEVAKEDRIYFSFKVSKIDRIRGKIPLKIVPSYPIPIQVEINDGFNKQVFAKYIYLTEMGVETFKDGIDTPKKYRTTIVQLLKMYRKMRISGDIDYYTLRQRVMPIISYDPTNVFFRLVHCYLCLQRGEKKSVLHEINAMDRYLLYFDKEGMDVSDLLLLFVSKAKREHDLPILRSWYPKSKNNALKIYIKNQLLNSSGYYDDYKALYELGVKDALLYIETSAYINEYPFVPSQEDTFYQSVLKWALRHDALGSKWLKKLETSFYQLTKHGIVDANIAKKLYSLSGSKNMLQLLCHAYIEEKCTTEEAVRIYEKALIEKVSVPSLEDYYIMAAYACNQLPNLNVIKLYYRPTALPKSDIDNFYLQLKVFKDDYKSLYYSHETEILNSSMPFFKQQITMDVNKKLVYARYLIDSSNLQHLLLLFEDNYFYDFREKELLGIIESVYELNEEFARPMAKKIYNDKGIYNNLVLKIIAPYYKGTLLEMLHFHKLLRFYNLSCDTLSEEILYKGLLTRLYPEEMVGVFAHYCESEKPSEWFLHYLTAMIINDALDATPQILNLLERGLEFEGDIPVGLAYLKASLGVVNRNEQKITQLLQKYISNDLVLPWFEQLLPYKQFHEKWKIMQCFEYHGRTDARVLFHYRIDDSDAFTTVEMKHFGLGLYITYVILFYNETIQYYIEEQYEDKCDIRLADLLHKEQIVEQEMNQRLYDSINTVEMCKTLNDFKSLQQTIETYITKYKRELDQLDIIKT